MTVTFSYGQVLLMIFLTIMWFKLSKVVGEIIYTLLDRPVNRLSDRINKWSRKIENEYDAQKGTIVKNKEIGFVCRDEEEIH